MNAFLLVKSGSGNLSTNFVIFLCTRVTKLYSYSARRDLRKSHIYYILHTCNTEGRYFLHFHKLHLQLNIPLGELHVVHATDIGQ